MREHSRTNRLVGAMALALLLAIPGVTPAQSVAVTGQEVAPFAYTAVGARRAESSEGRQLPQDIRIMQRIVSTALGEVEPPESPAALRDPTDVEPEAARAPRAFGFAFSFEETVGTGYVGGRSISGFYMPGYGYLFTVQWRIGGRFGDEHALEARAAELAALARRAGAASASSEEAESRAANEARSTLEAERELIEERRQAWQTWAAEYRSRLAEELAGVLAQYGSTLDRAQPDESITFIADFGGGDAETATATARRGDLSGVGREENLDAVRLARGEAEITEQMRTELKIMSAIVDSSLQDAVEHEAAVVYSGRAWRFDGGDSFQYVPGYGVLFRKPARLNLATRVVQSVSPSRSGSTVSVESLRDRIDQSTEEQRESYAEHLEALKRSSAEILATYGPTLTRLDSNEWVGIYYDVGSGAGLLEGGISNFLVQARMESIRTAASQTDPAAWLMQHLVTNEKQD